MTKRPMVLPQYEVLKHETLQGKVSKCGTIHFLMTKRPDMVEEPTHTCTGCGEHPAPAPTLRDLHHAFIWIKHSPWEM